MIVGGSTGAAALNEAVRNLLPTLLRDFQIIHLCGKGKSAEEYNHMEGYRQFEYISKEMKDLFAAADLVISRAGANSICELLALRKPHILVPLSAAASRGDQILNAESFEHQGFSYVLQEENLTNDTLLSAIRYVTEHRKDYIDAMEKSKLNEAITTVLNLLETAAKDKRK